MVYGEFGVTPISLLVEMRVLKYWYIVINSKNSKLSNILYRTAFGVYERFNVELPRLKFVHATLNSSGLIYICDQQSFESPTLFRGLVKSKIRVQYRQTWNSYKSNSAKCLNYRLYTRTFQFEEFFKKLSVYLLFSNVLM